MAFHSECPESYNTDTQRLIKSYENVNKQIRRFSSQNNLSKTIRLHRYSAPQGFIDHLSDKGITLLTADDDRISYQLSPNQCKTIKDTSLQFAGVKYQRTDIRVENLPIAIFTPPHRHTLTLSMGFFYESDYSS